VGSIFNQTGKVEEAVDMAVKTIVTEVEEAVDMAVKINSSKVEDVEKGTELPEKQPSELPADEPPVAEEETLSNSDDEEEDMPLRKKKCFNSPLD